MDTDPALQACPGCATLIDVSEQEPFAQVHCPICEMTIRARTEFNNFTLVDVLGSGGMGAVYRALDRTLNRYVALKVVRREFSKDPEHLAQFEREAQITASISHPHVVKVFSYGDDHGSFYIAMELVNRGSLDELIAEKKRVPEARAIQIGYQIAQGLRAAHNVGLIHRDIKPGNILFADADTAKIVDFGLATVFEREAESRGEIWGTPYYVPPERLRNQAEDFRSDIYSLGATLFHAIAGRPPFEATTVSVAALRHIKNHAVSLLEVAPDVSAPTSVVIDRMLKQNPKERFESYDELIEMLAYAGSKLSVRGVKVPGPEKTVAVPKRSSSFTRLALVALLLMGGFVGYSYFKAKGYDARRLVIQLKGFASGQGTNALPGAVGSSNLLFGKYQAARAQLFAGDYGAASAAFAEIQDSPTINPLMLRWVLFHKGLAQLLGENFHESEASFASLFEAGMFSDLPSDKALAEFFVETGGLASMPMLESGAIHPKQSPNGCEALKDLVLGIKQWRMGNKAEAGALLANFSATAPAENCLPYAKIGDYQAIAKKYLEDYRAEVSSSEKSKPADTPSQADKGIATAEVEASAKLAETKKVELETVAKAQEKFMAELSGYRFSSAHHISDDLKLTADESLKKREVLLKLAGWLDEFKKTLIADLSKEGYPFNIKAAKGSVLEGGIGGASDTELQIKTPYGSIPIAWEKVSPDSILEIAAYFLKKERNPATFTERKWKMGVYACQFGRGKQWRPILAEMAPSKSDYADSLEGMLELSR